MTSKIGKIFTYDRCYYFFRGTRRPKFWDVSWLLIVPLLVLLHIWVHYVFQENFDLYLAIFKPNYQFLIQRYRFLPLYLLRKIRK